MKLRDKESILDEIVPDSELTKRAQEDLCENCGEPFNGPVNTWEGHRVCNKCYNEFGDIADAEEYSGLPDSSHERFSTKKTSDSMSPEEQEYYGGDRVLYDNDSTGVIVTTMGDVVKIRDEGSGETVEVSLDRIVEKLGTAKKTANWSNVQDFVSWLADVDGKLVMGEYTFGHLLEEGDGQKLLQASDLIGDVSYNVEGTSVIGSRKTAQRSQYDALNDVSNILREMNLTQSEVFAKEVLEAIGEQVGDYTEMDYSELTDAVTRVLPSFDR